MVRLPVPPLFNIDVYATEFPRDRGWRIYCREAVKALIYRTDLGRSEQLRVLSDFLGLRIDQWILDNEAAAKEYAQAYREFCAYVNLPAIYRRIMNSSRFCRHFWPADLIARWEKKWATAVNSLDETPGEAPNETSRALARS